eukprot:TRINITY_DN7206_c0_g1_i1.p1 TRINITY_DN7206_c0_g1~~TRINITY_DN7206_c0_g1_i1.p1  ORF type:complete len:840 (+),score=214.72 TRINITY_DN7206_c0_g1_i1:201-2720(+)
MAPLAVGSAVEVWSNSNQAWLPGTIGAMRPDAITVDFRAGGVASRKDVPIGHEYLRLPGGAPLSYAAGSFAGAHGSANGYAAYAANSWSVSQARELVKDGPRPRGVQTLDGTDSVRAAVDGLNAGTLQCPAGMCLVRSARTGTEYLLFRGDKQVAALALLTVAPPRPPMATLHPPASGLKLLSRRGSSVLNGKQAKTLAELDVQARENYKTLSLALHGNSDSTIKHLVTSHFRKCDVDGDGKVNLAEATTLVRSIYDSLQLAPPEESSIRAIFSNYDADDSGFIEEGEFPQLFRRLVRLALASFKVVGKEELVRKAKLAFRDRYELGNRLAAGAQGATYLATERASGRTVVVKKPFDTADTADFDMLRDKTHPNIVRVFELFASPAETFVVMELCSGGDLFKTMEYCGKEFGGMTYNFIASCTRQTMMGINYLHTEFKATHNDIKPENVLLERKPRSLDDVPRCMVADFGCVSLGSGDWRYAAPEIWPKAGGHASYASDVYAIGVMVFEMLSGGYLPCVDHRNVSGWGAFLQAHGGAMGQQLAQSIAEGAEPNWKRLGNAADAAQGDLCRRMLRRDRTQRIPMREALKHPWFDSIGRTAEPVPTQMIEQLSRRAQLSDLKIALLNLVASRLQGESLTYYRGVWNTFDTDGDGRISQEAFVQLLSSPEIGIRDVRAMELYAMADVDGNGSIDFNEFVAIMFNPDALTREQLEEHFKSIFHSLMSKNNGSARGGQCCPKGHGLFPCFSPVAGYRCDLCRQGLDAHAKMWSCRECNWDECGQCFEKRVSDDGAGGCITLGELESVFPATMSKTLIQQLFKEIDKDADGTIDFNEFSSFLSAM